MKLYFFDVNKFEKKYIEKFLKDLNPILIEEPLNKKNVNKYKNASIISIFVTSKIDKEILKSLPNLKLVSTRSTGCDHIDLGELKRKNINFCCVPGYGKYPVAEYTFGLILSLSRKIIKANNELKESLFFNRENLMGFDLKNKTLGVVGVGNIGTQVIKIGKSFEMNILAFDIHKNQKLAKELGFKYTKDLNSLLAKSDIITLHVPYNKATHHLINKKNIKKIKTGSYIINTSRGGIIQTEALIYALDKNIINNAALDVLEEENLLKEKLTNRSVKKLDSKQLKMLLNNYLLIRNKNILVTPHNAFNSKEACTKILEETEKCIRLFLKNNVKKSIFS